MKLRSGFERSLEVIVLALMTALAVLVVVGVAFRKAGAALVWYDEVASILLAWLTYYGASYAALKRAHIGFPKVVESLGPRARLVAMVVREVAVLGFFILVAWTGWQVVRVLEGTYLISLPAISRQLSQSVIPVGAVLFIAAELVSAGDVFKQLRAPSEGREP